MYVAAGSLTALISGFYQLTYAAALVDYVGKSLPPEKELIASAHRVESNYYKGNDAIALVYGIQKDGPCDQYYFYYPANNEIRGWRFCRLENDKWVFIAPSGRLYRLLVTTPGN